MAKENDAAIQAEGKPQAEAKASPVSAPKATTAPAGNATASAGVDPNAPKRKKTPGKPPRRGKKLRNILKNIEKRVGDAGQIPLKQGLVLLKQIKRAKFDETVELHINLGIDSTQSDQMVRGSVPLPHGLGKTVRVVVFCQGENVAKAKAAGADYAGSADLVEKIQKENWLDFDVAITTQDMMPQVSRLGKILGPRGLMPTPKAGTVISANADVAAAVKEFKAGKVEYRSDKTGQIHCGVGKLSFDDQKLVENITTLIEAVRGAKPAGIKGNYINGIVLSATMCPGIRVTI